MGSNLINIGIRKSEITGPKKEEGFTIVEALLAIVILAIGLLAIAAMQTSALKANTSAGDLTERSTWAQDKMEELIALPYTDPWLESAGNPPGTDSAGNTHQQTSSDGFYTISWTVQDNTPVQNTKTITVTSTGKGKTTRFVFVRSSQF